MLLMVVSFIAFRWIRLSTPLTRLLLLVLTFGVVPFLCARSSARDHCWTWPQLVGLPAFAGAVLATVVFVEGRVAQPIVSLELFRNTTFAVSMIVGCLTAFGMFGSIL